MISETAIGKNIPIKSKLVAAALPLGPNQPADTLVIVFRTKGMHAPKKNDDVVSSFTTHNHIPPVHSAIPSVNAFVTPYFSII